MRQAIGKANTSATSPARSAARVWDTNEERDYDRRLRAAGLVPGVDPEQDMDAFRNELARMINMFINKWHGCPQPLCKRNRGCMAPHIHCANLPQPTPEQIERDWPRVQAEVYKALQAEIARRGEEDE